ncbi:hypothetical protein OROMI_004808 [Orobanche minor]
MPVWTLTSNGDFSFKSAWELVRQKKPTNKILTFCWNSFITPTISIFMVRLFFKWIPTTDGLLRRGIIANNLCYCCNGVENMAHLFIHGPVAKVVWNYFQNLAGIDRINSNNINHIINNWFSRTKGNIHIFHIIPILILWFLWCCRNDKRVDNVPFTPNRVCKRIWSYIDTFKSKLKNKIFFWKGAEAIARRAGVQPGPRPVYKIIPVRWLKPGAGWWKLNTDGASRGNPREAASGGILRDNLGTPSFMFSEFLGECSNNYAELYAIWRGLDLCVSRNVVKVWIETDSNTALHLIKNHNNSHWKLLGLLNKIWNLMDIIEVRFSHIFREGNAVADWLANEGCHRRDFFLYNANNISRKLRGFIKLDKMSYPYIRSRKTYGGFGCRDLHDIIRAGICKMRWRFRTSDNIWSNFLMNKYCPRLHPMTIKLSLKSSHVWKNLCDVRSFANTKIFWHSGNGNVSFWHDSCCDMSPLNDFSNNKSKDTIQNYWINGKWDRMIISCKLISGLCDHICSFPTSPSGILPSWTLSPDGDFDFKSTWHFIRKKKPLDNILRFCWNPIITPTISVFMVRLVNKWIPRRMVFFVGVFIRPISAIVVMMMKIFLTFLFMARWLTSQGNDRRVDNVPFTANRVCERIWNYINTFNHKVIFKNKKFWKGAALIADRVGVIAAPKPIYKCCSVRWSKPQPGWWKLNTDGAARGNLGDAAAGGIIRDHVGKPLIMFSEFLRDRTNNFAELYAIWRGLEFCIDNHFDKVWVEVDSKIALSLIEHSTTSHWQLQGIISKIHDFRGSIEIRFSHIFIEGNAVADWLANHGCDRKDFFLHNVYSISGKLLGLIKLDKMSYPYIRSKKTFMS